MRTLYSAYAHDDCSPIHHAEYLEQLALQIQINAALLICNPLKVSSIIYMMIQY